MKHAQWRQGFLQGGESVHLDRRHTVWDGGHARILLVQAPPPPKAPSTIRGYFGRGQRGLGSHKHRGRQPRFEPSCSVGRGGVCSTESWEELMEPGRHPTGSTLAADKARGLKLADKQMDGCMDA